MTQMVRHTEFWDKRRCMLRTSHLKSKWSWSVFGKISVGRDDETFGRGQAISVQYKNNQLFGHD